MKKIPSKYMGLRYHAKFEVQSEDNPQSLENAILDKLGENDIKWEYLGEMNDNKKIE